MQAIIAALSSAGIPLEAHAVLTSTRRRIGSVPSSVMLAAYACLACFPSPVSESTVKEGIPSDDGLWRLSDDAATAWSRLPGVCVPGFTASVERSLHVVALCSNGDIGPALVEVESMACAGVGHFCV